MDNTSAMMNLQSALNRLIDKLSMSLNNPTTDDNRVADERSRALELMQDEEQLDTEEKIMLMTVFAKSPAICATCISSRAEYRLLYLQSVVRQAQRHILQS
jgi:hypothetical protein